MQFISDYTDSIAKQQVDRLKGQSAYFKIKLPFRLAILATVTGVCVTAILYPYSVGVPLFFLGLLNYLLLISFRISNNTGKVGQAAPDARPAPAPDAWPRFTILLPLKREAEVVRGTVQAVKDLDYPEHLKQVLLIVEETDHITRNTLQHIRLPENFSLLLIPERPPFTKGRALLYGLRAAQGDYLTIYDAESRPEPQQMQKAARILSGTDGSVCLQARIRISNPNSNWITRNFAGEYYEWYNRHLQGLSNEGLPFGLGGNSFFIATEALRQAGAWDPFNVTEDADLAVRLVENGIRLRMLDSETTESCPEHIPEWARQRTRWNKGLFITQLVHLHRSFRSRQFGLSAWIHFWLPMFCSGLLPFFNAFIPLFLLSGRLSYGWFFAFSTVLWTLLLINLLSSTLINRLTYQRLGILGGLPLAFFDSIAYMFLHLAAGFKAYAGYFWSPLHWHKTEHSESCESEDEWTSQGSGVPVYQVEENLIP